MPKIKKIVIVSFIASLSFVLLGTSMTQASEVTGTLSSNGSNQIYYPAITGASLSGDVIGESTISGTITSKPNTGGNSIGGTVSGGNTGENSGGGEVLGALSSTADNPSSQSYEEYLRSIDQVNTQEPVVLADYSSTDSSLNMTATAENATFSKDGSSQSWMTGRSRVIIISILIMILLASLILLNNSKKIRVGVVR